MTLKSLLGLNCEDAAGYCNKAEYQEASVREKFMLRVHLFFCSPCKDLNHKNHKLSELIRQANLKSCSEDEKELYKQKMEENSELHKK